MIELFSVFATTQQGMPVLSFCVLVAMSAHRKVRSFFTVTWETLGGILGSTVAVGAMLKGSWNYGLILKKRRDDRRREDDENRKTLEDFPELMRRFNDAVSQIETIGKGVKANTETLDTVSEEVIKLRRDQDYYRKLKEIELDEAGVCWFECDATGRTIAVSQGLCDLFGLAEEQMLKDGSGWLSVVEESDLVYKQWEKSVQQRLPYRATYMVTRKHGESFFVEARAERIDSDGETYRFRGTVKKTGVKY